MNRDTKSKNGIIDALRDEKIPNDEVSKHENLISYFVKYKKIEDIVRNAEEIIANTYGAVIPEGYADVFNEIKKVIEQS